MKNHCTLKFIRKAITLAGLITLLVFIASSDLLTRHTEAHFRACDIYSQYNAIVACGTNYETSKTQFDNRGYDCLVSAQSDCPFPNMTGWTQQQINQAMADQNACVENKLYICENARTIVWNDRWSTYGNCLNGNTGMFYNPDLCTPASDPCPDAMNQVSMCEALFPYFQDYETDVARSRCIIAIPHARSCPGCPAVMDFAE